MPRHRIIIIGGGFAGVACAKTLRKRLTPDQGEIVIFNSENHTVFHPLLAEVAGASINPDAVTTPLRQTLPSVHCRTETVKKIDLQKIIAHVELVKELFLIDEKFLTYHLSNKNFARYENLLKYSKQIH